MDIEVLSQGDLKTKTGFHYLKIALQTFNVKLLISCHFRSCIFDSIFHVFLALFNGVGHTVSRHLLFNENKAGVVNTVYCYHTKVSCVIVLIVVGIGILCNRSYSCWYRCLV